MPGGDDEYAYVVFWQGGGEIKILFALKNQKNFTKAMYCYHQYYYLYHYDKMHHQFGR